MEITKDLVKELREKTNAGVMDCKRALAEAEGDLPRATQILKNKGIAGAHKKAHRTTANGLIYSYIHAGGKVGVLLEINCETDFVARNKVFQDLAKDISLQIAGAHPSPLCVSKDSVGSDLLSRLTKQFQDELHAHGKNSDSVQKEVQDRLEKYFSEVCLLAQPFIKDSSITIGQLIQTKISETGENIVIRRFVRYQLGE